MISFATQIRKEQIMQTIWEATYTLEQIEPTAQKFLQIAAPHEVWAFSGQLGAGKTTFVAALMQALRCTDPVSSPTFSIINHYKLPESQVFHSDWYRIADEEEAIQSGIEDMMLQPGIKIIEWWERAPELLPPNTLYIRLSVLDAQSRKLEVKAES